MKAKKRKPLHPGVILEEHYLKPLNLSLQKLADHLGIARNTLFKIRTGRGNITPGIALALGNAFDTTPQFWLNLQQKYDLWIEENEKSHVKVAPLYKEGVLMPFEATIRPRKRAESSQQII